LEVIQAGTSQPAGRPCRIPQQIGRSLYARLTEGFETADLIAAKRLLDEFGDIRRN